jgi:lipopolysaccharide/colanic/teichoic acid biosynthesis glycosyltransferase
MRILAPGLILTARQSDNEPLGAASVMKRLLDIVGSLVGLLLLAPLFAVLWICVVVGSGRPGFFAQRRVGRRSRDFTLYKFRTMATRAGAEHGSFDVGSVARVTRVGRFLRASKLDELPQLWNVLRGDMALVGPRPEVREWVDAYPDRWEIVLSVRPGITDPASIEFRNEEEMLARSEDPHECYRNDILPRKLDLYRKYVENQTLWTDIQLILQTLWTVARR